MLNETWNNVTNAELIMQCMKYDINTADGSGETILLMSSRENLTDRVMVLLNNTYLDVNKGRGDGTTALHFASMRENLNVIKMLLSHQSLDPNRVNNNYMTALMEASRDGKSEVVELLLKHPIIDVNRVNLHRKSALFFACEKGNIAVVRLLLKCPTTKTDLYDEDSNIAFDYADNNTKQQFYNHASLRNSGHTCCSEEMKKGLQKSAKTGDFKMTEAFMNCHGMDLNYGYGNDEIPLYLASKANNSAIVRILLEHSEIEVNKKVGGTNALLAATREGNAEVVRVLLQHSDIDTNIEEIGNTGNALFIASETGHSKIVKELLLQPQIEVNKRFRIENITALEVASKKSYLHVVKMLLRCPKTKIDNAKLVMFETLNKSMSSIRNTLLKITHTCCLKENEGLLTAGISGDYRAIRGLGQCPKADINTVDAKGRTPLYFTSLLGHAEATEEILKQEKISFNKGREIDGLTPFSIASQKGHKGIMTLLTEYSYQNGEDVNNGWQGDEWTDQYGGKENGNGFTQFTTSTSYDYLAGYQKFPKNL